MIDLFRRAWTWIQRLRSRRLLTGTLRHDGLIRSYLLYVPRHFEGRSALPLPLVLVFHGGSGAPAHIARSSALHQIAEREGFIVAYPAGVMGAHGLTWNPGGQALHSEVDDVGFVRALLDELARLYKIDPRRVYAAGMSVGGAMVYRLACSLAGRFAAVAVVAGVMTNDECDPAAPVSLIHIHGTADERVPLRGGHGRHTAWFNDWPPVNAGIERWCRINGCDSPAETIRLVDGLVGHRYTGAADVELWLVIGGRHVWPGAGARRWRRGAEPATFSASAKVWSFFSMHLRGED